MLASITLTNSLLSAFAELTRDCSSLHMDPAFARLTQFRGPVVHGLLPVACLLALQGAESAPSGRSLQRLACRFWLPARVGDTVLLEATPVLKPGQDSVSFRVTLDGSGELLSSGEAVFENWPREQPDCQALPAKTSFFAQPVTEQQWTAGQLAVGHEERLVFEASAAAMRNFMQHLEQALGEPAGFMAAEADVCHDANFAASLLASTMVGMRLPGKFATFVECELNFSRPLSASAAVELVGTVSRAHAASDRLQLQLQWLQAGEALGVGRATSLVGEALPEAVSCAAIRQQHQSLDLAGKVVLVTGASRGIGEATAKLLAMLGARTVVHYFRGQQAAEDIASDIRSHGGDAVALGADLRQEADTERLFEGISRLYGPVDVLVNNAVGDFRPRPLESLRAADFMDEMELTLFGVHTCCRQALPGMKSRRSGKIVNLGSITTELPVASQTRYIAAKSALVGYTRSLASELAGFNIQVNMVLPAMTQTSLLAAVPRELRKRMAEDSPMGRLLEPMDVAKTIAFLASGWSGAMTGQQLVLNQGSAPFL